MYVAQAGIGSPGRVRMLDLASPPITLDGVKPLRRRTAEPDLAAEPEVEVASPASGSGAAKGRPTPKRRDSAPRRPVITEAPRNRKEAYKWQKQQASRSRTTATQPRSKQEYREALRRGDPSALPKRDQGKVRKLARDWVDSHRMLSNFLLLLFPLLIISYKIRFANIIVIALFTLFLVEWYLTGRRLRRMAIERFGDKVDGRAIEGPWALGFYAGSRAYMPRRWRMPKPQVSMGEQI